MSHVGRSSECIHIGTPGNLDMYLADTFTGMLELSLK